MRLSNSTLRRVFAGAVFSAVAAGSLGTAGQAITYPAPVTQATPYGVMAPEGVRIPVQLVGQVSSATANVNDRFDFKTSQDVKLGDLTLLAGTPGHGRIAAVTRADKDHNGTITLQADSIDMPDGTPLWVNSDTNQQIKGHYSDKHTHFDLIIIGTNYSGNIVLDPGASFDVITSARRTKPADLMTDPNAPAPAVPAPASIPAAPAPAPSAT